MTAKNVDAGRRRWTREIAHRSCTPRSPSEIDALLRYGDGLIAKTQRLLAEDMRLWSVKS